MFYFYSGEKPENPCEKCGFYKDNDCTIYDTELLCPKFKTYAAEQSIIDKLVEVNLNKMLKEYEKYKHNLGGNCVSGYEIPMPFEQFIQQQMNLSNKSNSSQEGKTKYQATYNQDGSIDVYPQEASHDKDS